MIIRDDILGECTYYNGVIGDQIEHIFLCRKDIISRNLQLVDK